MPPSPGVRFSRCCAYQGSFRKSSKSVVNSLSISAKVPVFQGFAEIIKVVYRKLTGLAARNRGREVRNKTGTIFRAIPKSVHPPTEQRSDPYETSQHQMPLLRLPGAPAPRVRGIRLQSRSPCRALLCLCTLSGL